jgi:dTMP kinase
MIIAIEGIDGAGKETQARLLAELARAEGLRVGELSFPRYGETVYADSIVAYLGGAYGPLSSIPAQLPALLFAGDRLESRELVAQLTAANDLLILDRYIASNIAYQSARIAGDRRPFIEWISRIELTAHLMPIPDLHILLDLTAPAAAHSVAERRQREHPGEQLDIHEANVDYLAACREVYLQLANEQTFSPWHVVACLNEDGERRSRTAIHEQIWDAVHASLPSSVPTFIRP